VRQAKERGEEKESSHGTVAEPGGRMKNHGGDRCGIIVCGERNCAPPVAIKRGEKEKEGAALRLATLEGAGRVLLR